MSEKIIRPWVDVETDDNGDLHLASGVRGVANMVTHRVLSMEQKAINDWLKVNGWASPDEKKELLDALERVVYQYEALLKDCAFESVDTLRDARAAIAQAKGEQ